MHGAFIFLVLLGGSSLSRVSAFSNGRVTLACVGMTPGHGLAPISTPPPFSVVSGNSTYVAGQKITVTLQANQTAFRGFLLQARDAVTGEGPVGMFSVMGSEAQLLDCSREASAVSHTSSSMKTTVQATWTPPASGVRDIEFRATFVQNFSTFWVGVRSAQILFTGVIPNTTEAPRTTTVPGLGNSTPTTPNSSPSLSFSHSLLLLLPLLLLTFPNRH